MIFNSCLFKSEGKVSPTFKAPSLYTSVIKDCLLQVNLVKPAIATEHSETLGSPQPCKFISSTVRALQVGCPLPSSHSRDDTSE